MLNLGRKDTNKPGFLSINEKGRPAGLFSDCPHLDSVLVNAKIP